MKQYRFVGASIFFCILLALSSSWAQHTFMKNYSFDHDINTYIGQSAVSAFDTSIVSCGNFQEGGAEAVLCKVNQNGKVVWSYRFYNPENTYFTTVTVSPDGSIFAAGSKLPANAPFLVKLDPGGTLLWCHYYFIGTSVTVSSIIQSRDGGIVLIGSRLDGTFIAKTDSLGALLWAKAGAYVIERQHGVSFDRVIEYPDATLLIGGVVRSEPIDLPIRQLLTTLRLTYAGDIISAAAYAIPGTTHTSPCFVQLPDAGFIAGIGTSDEFNNVRSILLHATEYDSLRWSINISALSNARLVSLIQSSRGELIGRLATPYGTQADNYAFRFSIEGKGRDLIRTPKVASAPIEQLLSLATSAGENYIVLEGGSQLGMKIATISDTLSVCESTAALYTNDPITLEQTVLLPNLTPLILQDTIISLERFENPITTSVICANQDEVQTPQEDINSLLLSPNPVSDHAAVTLTAPSSVHGAVEVYVRDLTGRTMYHTSATFDDARRGIQLPTSSLASGLYYIDLLDKTTFSRLWHGKMIVE